MLGWKKVSCTLGGPDQKQMTYLTFVCPQKHENATHQIPKALAGPAARGDAVGGGFGGGQNEDVESCKQIGEGNTTVYTSLVVPKASKV